ncbi:MAG: hypothetical protein FD180_598 [Planctomycetota bacterium]|nr:MAG: hypothetical protein FD180_598 [Planctomycetota bacterium]
MDSRAADRAGALADLEADGGTDTLSIADCRQALGRHAEAVKSYDAYLRHSRSLDVVYRRGVSRFAIGDRAGALEDFSRACLDEGSPRTAAMDFIQQHPGDPMSAVLQEALRPKPEAPR